MSRTRLIVEQRYVDHVKSILDDPDRERTTVEPASRMNAPACIVFDGDHADAVGRLDGSVATFGWRPEVDVDHDLDVPVDGQPQDSAAADRPRPIRIAASLEGNTDGEGLTAGCVDTSVAFNDLLFGAVAASPGEVLFDREDLDGDGDDRPDRQAGHATFVAGLILREAPAATVRVEGVLDNSGHALTSQAVDAAIRLAEQKVHVLNLSLGTHAHGEVPLGFRHMLREINPEIVIVAAAGNLKRVGSAFAAPAPFFPASLDGVLSVGAAVPTEGDAGDDRWVPAEYSNHGPWIDLFAYGTRLVSTFFTFQPDRPTADNPPFRGWAEWSGTSFATATVTGKILATMSRMHLTAREAADYLRRDADRHVDLDGYRVPVVTQQQWLGGLKVPYPLEWTR
ncbi:hypothetical protein GCM10009557_82650 [Virgisporangium ochraceum]|uniref:Peptidase S8/S53 domain-containing protein n=1 Tax=Virgisporangium ochraceum TaxID=65505 RepID=A0A8J4A2I5_9ACTN|nr:S8/S53 family peptidase [Virgisporangium ochraceum]GIJ73966.1 hypothetical protein Voc01_088830 [Virgisporangium ochraceum]